MSELPNASLNPRTIMKAFMQQPNLEIVNGVVREPVKGEQSIPCPVCGRYNGDHEPI